MKKFIVSILSIVIIYGCSSTEKSEIKEGISASRSERKVTDFNLDYYNKCKNEFKKSENKAYDYTIACENNGVNIEIAKDNDSNKILFIEIEGSSNNVKKVLDTLNAILNFYNEKTLTMKEFENITDENYDKIGNYSYNKNDVNGKLKIVLIKDFGK